MRPSTESVRQFVVSPAEFFAERPPADSLQIAIGLVVLCTICLTVSFFLVGSMLAGTVDGTITIDNPDRPPGPFCDHHDTGSALSDSCSEPETVDRDAGELFQEAVGEVIWVALIGPFVLWVGAGITLFVVGRVAGGTPSMKGALSLAGWAAIPEFVRLAAGLIGLHLALDGLSVDDVDEIEHVVEPAIESVDPILMVVSLVVAGWQWYLLAGGLAEDADLSWPAAAVGVAVPLGLFTLGTL